MTDPSVSSPLSSFHSYRRKQALALIAQELAMKSVPQQLGAGPTGDRVDPTAVTAASHQLPASPDASVVFTGLADLLVPALCEQATAVVHTGHDLLHLRSRTADISASRVDQVSRGWLVTVHTPAHRAGGDTDHEETDYVAVVTCSGRDAPTGQSVVAVELAARYAAALVAQARQAKQLQARQQQVDSLRVALNSNRLIGAAVGVLMATQQLTYQQAFDLLSRSSQNTNSKLAAVADMVLHTGCLPAH